MPRKDTHHQVVIKALVKDGWTITHDPYTLSFGQKDVYVDLGAERKIAAEKEGEEIAVEVKSFRSASDMKDFEDAIGQYAFYRSLLLRVEPDRKLFLAIPDVAFNLTFNEPIARPVLEDLQVLLFTFDPEMEVIVKWIR